MESVQAQRWTDLVRAKVEGEGFDPSPVDVNNYRLFGAIIRQLIKYRARENSLLKIQKNQFCPRAARSLTAPLELQNEQLAQTVRVYGYRLLERKNRQIFVPSIKKCEYQFLRLKQHCHKVQLVNKYNKLVSQSAGIQGQDQGEAAAGKSVKCLFQTDQQQMRIELKNEALRKELRLLSKQTKQADIRIFEINMQITTFSISDQQLINKITLKKLEEENEALKAKLEQLLKSLKSFERKKVLRKKSKLLSASYRFINSSSRAVDSSRLD